MTSDRRVIYRTLAAHAETYYSAYYPRGFETAEIAARVIQRAF